MKIDSTNRTLFLYSLRIFFFLMLALGLVGGLALLVNGKISWLLFVPGYTILAVASYYLYQKAVRFDPDTAKIRRKKNNIDDPIDPDAEEQKQKLLTKAVSWGIFGLLISILSLVAVDLLSPHFREWVKENYGILFWVIGIIAAILIAISLVVPPIQNRNIIEAVLTSVISIIVIISAIYIGLYWQPWKQWHWNTGTPASTVAIGKPWPNHSTIQPAVQRETVGTRQSDPVVILWDNEKAGYDTHWMMNRDMVPGQWHQYWKANVQRYWQAVRREDYDAQIYVRDSDTKDTVGIITFDPTDGTPTYHRTEKFTNHSGEYAWTTSKLMDVMITVAHE